MKISVIITGATGMVGEGVLMECLEHPNVERVLIVNRKHYDAQHPKLKELIVSNFMELSQVANELKGYDACFFCAGVSSVGMKEDEYRHLTYDLTLNFAKTLVEVNQNMVFTYVSGSHTDSTEKGKTMWARVKGKTENDLFKLPFKCVYAFRPAVMKPTKGQKSIKTLYKIIWVLYPLFRLLAPGQSTTLQVVGRAMINSVLQGYPKSILEVEDIKILGTH